MEGTTIGNWIVERKLGDGGMGVVYLAHHKTTGARAAVKALIPAQAHRAQALEIFHQEARTQMKLHHPHITQALDYHEKDGQFFLLLEYLDRSLADALEERPAPVGEAQAITWAKQMLQALDYAHQQGVIHRDIKPSNLMLDPQGNIKVTDFGIALDMGGERITETGMTKGTPEYMSPEQIVRPKEIDHRTDGYSVGIVLYELLTGRLPFTGATEYEVMEGQVKKMPPPLRSFNAAIPAKLEQIVLRALEKDPAKRFGGCGEFVRALEAYEHQRETTSPPPPRRTFLVLSVICIALLSALGLGYFLWPTRSTVEDYYDLREKMVRAEKFAEAGNEYQGKARQAPRDALWQGLLSYALLEQNKLIEAEAAVRKAIELEPQEALWTDLLGDVLLTQKKKEAQATYQKAVGLAANAPDRYLYLGDLAACQDDWKMAESHYSEVVKHHPKRPLFHTLLARALRRQKKWPEAEAAYKEAIRLASDNARYRNLLGDVFYEQKKWDEAIATYREAVRLQADKAPYHANLGAALLEKKDYAEAETAWQRAAELDPKNAAHHNYLGNALFGQKKYEEAETAYRKAVTLKSDNVVFQANLAGALWEQKKFKDATPIYEKATGLAPKNDFYFNRLGLCRWELANWTGAEKAFRTAAELKPNEPLYHNNLGLALEKLSYPCLAADEYQKAMNLDANNQTYRQNYERTRCNSPWPLFPNWRN